MRVGVLTQTTVSDGHRARAASSVVYWPACKAEGAPTFGDGAEAGADDCHHGNKEPDWEAGAGGGANQGGVIVSVPDGKGGTTPIQFKTQAEADAFKSKAGLQ